MVEPRLDSLMSVEKKLFLQIKRSLELLVLTDFLMSNCSKLSCSCDKVTKQNLQLRSPLVISLCQM